MANTNRIVDAIHAQNEKIVETGNAVAAATDKVAKAVSDNGTKVIEATDKVAVKVVEGVNAIITASNKAQAAADKGNGYLSGMVAAQDKTNAKLDSLLGKHDTTNTKLEAGNTNTAAALVKLEALKTAIEQQQPNATDAQAAATAATTAAGTQGGTAKGAAEGLFSSVKSSSSSLAYTPGEGAAPTLAIEMPAAFGGKTFNFDPFSNDRLGVVISWFRTAVGWLVVVGMGIWVWNQIDIKTAQASQTQQAKGNTVAAGTGGQATALVAAAGMTVAIVALLTALLGWSFGEISLPGVLSAMSSNPLTSLPGGVLWMLNKVFPVGLIITAYVAKLAWKMYSVPLFAGCAAAVRFIVP